MSFAARLRRPAHASEIPRGFGLTALAGAEAAYCNIHNHMSNEQRSRLTTNLLGAAFYIVSAFWLGFVFAGWILVSRPETGKHSHLIGWASQLNCRHWHNACNNEPLGEISACVLRRLHPSRYVHARFRSRPQWDAISSSDCCFSHREGFG